MNILITGSTKGLGAILAEQLSKQHNIIKHSRTPVSIDDNTMFEKVFGDLSDNLQCEAISKYLIDNEIRVDALICNAGSGKSAKMGEETKEDWSKSFNDNFFSTVNIVKALEENLASTSGKIVCIGSICGNRYIEGAPLTYSCAKAALMNYVRHNAAYLSSKSIQIVYLALGNMIFPGSTWESKKTINPDAIKEMLDSAVPLRRFGEVKNIVGFIDWFISPENRFSTGSSFTIDGGQTI